MLTVGSANSSSQSHAFKGDTDEWFKLTPEETFTWVITKGDLRWEKSELGTKVLIESVAALHCGSTRRSGRTCRDTLSLFRQGHPRA